MIEKVKFAKIRCRNPVLWPLPFCAALMIVCEKPAFVFVHVFKTAGTSIKRALRRYAMPSWHEYANSVFKRVGIPQFGPPAYPDHLLASQLVEQIGLDKFKSYFSFAFVRNPWDWELSHYKYILRSKSHHYHQEVSGLKDFSEYVRWRCDGRFKLQGDFVVMNDEIVVDYVGRFENLENDFQLVCNRLDINSTLARLNTTRRTSYREHYNDTTAELIRRTYLCDILRFGYKFEDPQTSAA